MKKMQFRKIRTRLTFWLFMVSLGPLLVVASIIFTQRLGEIKNSQLEKLTAIRDLKVRELNAWLEGVQDDTRVIAEDLEIRTAAESFFPVEAEALSPQKKEALSIARDLLRRYREQFAHYEELFVINSHTGVIVFSSSATMEGLNKSNDPSFTEPLRTKKIYLKDIYHSKVLGRPAMTFSLPVYSISSPGVITGVLVVRIDLESSLYRILQDRTGMGRTGETLLVNKNVLALNKLRWHEDAVLNLTIRAKPAALASQGLTGIIETEDYRQERVLAAYTHIENTGWGFVAKQDLSELNAPIQEMFVQFAFILLFSSLIVCGIAFSLGRTISWPITEITSVTERIEGGDRSARIIIYREDELGFLADSINNLAEAISSQLQVQESSSEIIETIVKATGLQDFARLLIDKLTRITGSHIGVYYILDPASSCFQPYSSCGAEIESLLTFSADGMEGQFGPTLSSRQINHLRDIPEDTVFSFRTVAGTALPREIISLPIIIDNQVKALVGLASLHAFSPESIASIEQSRPTLNTVLSNLLTSEKIQSLVSDLRLKNQELQAQSEELQSKSQELTAQSEELWKQNEKLQFQRVEVEEANRLKSEFLSNMSHELRTPLNSVMALSKVLMTQARDRLSEEETGYLQIVSRNGEKLLNLINDILDLAKIEAGRVDIQLKPFQLSTTLEAIVESLLPLAEKKGIALSYDLKAELPVIENDEMKIHQILQNIVGNAVKFTDSGVVSVSAFEQEKNICIQVTDTGIGIAATDLNRIFDEFTQVDGSTSRRHEGTGLGLAIARKNARLLGGDILVSSTLGQGSTFTFILPRQWQGTILGAPSAEEAVSLPDDIPWKKTILVVDDDAATAANFAEQLFQAGYQSVIATTGEQALELAAELSPFAITLDILMPDMDGLEVLQQLKANPDTTHIPVLIVSVSPDKPTGDVLGAAGQLVKPVRPNALVHEINKIISEMEKIPKSRTLLLVEDNETVIHQVESILLQEGFRVQVARDGWEAFAFVAKEIPDGIILDLMMPGIDGFAVLDQIRKRPSTTSIPVLILTAKDLTGEDRQKLASGYVQHLVQKGNINKTELLTKIKAMLGILPQPMAEKADRPPVRPARSRTQTSYILAVEDNADNMATLQAVLKGHYQLKEALDGEAALRMIKEEIPDLILLDITLPKIDGYSLAGKIRSDIRTKYIPIIALTAHAMKGDREKIMAAGCSDYLSKPVDVTMLMEKLAKWLPAETCQGE